MDFDIKKTKGTDFYISISESTRRLNGEGFDKHMIFLYKEDFNRFLECLQQTIDEVKEKLLPDFDYNSFMHRENNTENQDFKSSENLPEENNLTW